MVLPEEEKIKPKEEMKTEYKVSVASDLD